MTITMGVENDKKDKILMITIMIDFDLPDLMGLCKRFSLQLFFLNFLNIFLQFEKGEIFQKEGQEYRWAVGR